MANESLPYGLPLALRRLLEASDGGETSADAVLRVPDGSTAGSISILSAENISSTTQTLLGSGSPHAVWARNGNGNALTIDKEGLVYFWDHDTDQELPFACQLDQLHEHFFRREQPRHAGSTTANALSKLIECEAPTEEIREFLKKDLSPETAPAFLRVAVSGGLADVVDAILRVPNVVPPSALSASLRMAASRGLVEMLSTLVSLGAPVDDRDPKTGMTALMEAASAGQRGSIIFLLEQGADPSLTTRRGRSAASMARTSSRPELAELLSET